MSRIVGIDLGTSTSEIAILRDGKPFVIPDLSGDTIIPSVVGINAEGKIIVGKEAREQLLLKPENAVMEIKRLMGSGTKVKMAGKEYTPQEISSHILMHLISYATEYLGEKIDRAVITVPAYFTDEQRRATLEAGKLAGLKVERIINEPTAAALDYGIDHMDQCKNILVYDLGGGTLDVTVLEMFEGVIEVKASCGNNELGGKDFDELLIEHLLDTFSKMHQIDVKSNLRAMMRLKDAAEKCKIALSTHEHYHISIPFFAEKNGVPVSFEEDISRETFEASIKPLIDSTELQIRASVSDAGLKNSEIDLVILVGGSTRIPYVKKFLTQFLGTIPGSLVDPDMAVARGASIQAGILNEELSSETDILITDVCPYTLGLSTVAQIGMTFREDVFDPIIKRNITIPIVKEKIYYTCADNQTAVEIEVYQGEYKTATMNNFLGKFLLQGIPEAPAGEEKIKVSFSYDVNGILGVEAIIVNTGKKANITVLTAEEEMKKEVDLTLWKEAKNAKKFRVLIKKAERVLDNNEAGDFELEIDNYLKDLKVGLIEGIDNETLGEIKDDLESLLFELEGEIEDDD